MPPWIGNSGAPVSSALPSIRMLWAEAGQRLLDLPLEEAALLLDHHDLPEVPRELADRLGIERVDQSHAQQPDAERRSAASSTPRSRSAWRQSAYDLPAVTMPTPVAGRADLGSGEAVRARVRQDGPVALVVELALGLDVQPREEREVGRLPERLAVDHEPRQDDPGLVR